MPAPDLMRRAPRAVALLLAMGGVGLDATSIARLPPEPSTRSRAEDTPVVDHIPGGGPDGGAVYSVAVLNTNPVTLFAALEHGGVFSSTNAGRTWTPADRGLPGGGTCELVAAPDASAMYAACGDGLFKTTNTGGLWRQLDIDNPRPPAIAPSASRVLYQPPDWGVVRSRDGGRRWEHRHGSMPTDCKSAFAIDPLEPLTLFCGDEQWMKISRDGGATWRPLTPGTRPDAQISSIAIDPSNPQTILAGTSDGRAFRTTDRGKVWYRVADGPATGAIESLHFIDRSSGVLFATQGSSIIRTVDGGDHWELLPSPWADWESKTFAVDPLSASTVYAGTLRGVMVTTDLGKHWELRRRGITRTSVSVAVSPDGPFTLHARTIDETFASSDGGDTWTVVDSQTQAPDVSSIRLPSDRKPSSIAAAANDPRIMYVSFGGLPFLDRNEIWRTVDGGEHWQLVDQPSSGSIGHCCGLLVDPNDANTVYAIVTGVGIGGGGNIVRRTTDGGITWSEMPVPGLSYSITLLPTVPTTLLVQAYDVSGQSRYAFLKSTDRGEHWVRTGEGLPNDIEITNIVVDPRQPARLFAGTHGRGVFRSIDGGTSWSAAGR